MLFDARGRVVQRFTALPPPQRRQRRGGGRTYRGVSSWRQQRGAGGRDPLASLCRGPNLSPLSPPRTPAQATGRPASPLDRAARRTPRRVRRVRGRLRCAEVCRDVGSCLDYCEAVRSASTTAVSSRRALRLSVSRERRAAVRAVASRVLLPPHRRVGRDSPVVTAAQGLSRSLAPRI